MRLSTDRRCLGQVASTLGILQGAAWAVMCLAAIILYNSSPTIETPTTYRKLVESVIYKHFITGDSYTNTAVQFIIRPSDFTIFMWIFFLLSVGWVALSIDLFTAIHTNKQRQTTIMITWGSVTLIVSLIDLIFVCLLGRDYSVCNELATDTDTDLDNYHCYLAVGIIMSLAARGYTLWVVNLIFAFCIIYAAANVIKENTGFGSLYSCQGIPRVKIPKSDTTGSLYRNDNNNYDFPSPAPVPLPGFQTSSSLGQTKKHPRKSESDLPSFLSRGDKFTY